MAEEEGRKRGRPPSNTMQSFQVSGKLLDNHKFIKFRRELDIPEKYALAIITKLFYFIANHRTTTPTLAGIDPSVIAEILYWEDDPQILINALIESGFLTENLEVVNWFDNQPFAAKKFRDRKDYEKRKGE